MDHSQYRPVINRFSKIEPIELDRGVIFHDMMVQKMGPKTVIVGLATFKPNAGLPCHCHNVEECITILRGTAFCDIAGKRTHVQPYDTSFVPAEIPHRFVNASDTEELMIHWTYSQVNISLDPVEDVQRIILDSSNCMG